MQKINWLDYTIMKNPEGVMKVLADNGYTGYLAPVNMQELHEACIIFMDKSPEENTVELLMAHPDIEILLLLAGKTKKKSINESEEEIVGSTNKDTLNKDTLKAIIKQEKATIIKTALIVSVAVVVWKLLK